MRLNREKSNWYETKKNENVKCRRDETPALVCVALLRLHRNEYLLVFKPLPLDVGKKSLHIFDGFPHFRAQTKSRKTHRRVINVDLVWVWHSIFLLDEVVFYKTHLFV